MEIVDHDTSSSSELFHTCSEVEEHVGQSSNIWCWEMIEDDYSQIFHIAGFYTLISLGYYLLLFGSFIWATTSVKGLSISHGGGVMDIGMDNVPQIQWYNGRVNSKLALPLYLSLCVLINAIYIGTVCTYTLHILYCITCSLSLSLSLIISD